MHASANKVKLNANSLGVRIALALILLVVIIGLVNYAYYSRVAQRNLIADIQTSAQGELASMQSAIQYAFATAGDHSQVQAQLAAFGADPKLHSAVIVDQDQRIIASSRRIWIDEPFQIAAESVPNLSGTWANALKSARSTLRGSTFLDADKDYLGAVYPIRLAQQRHVLRPSLYGALVVTYDLRARKAMTARIVAAQAAFFTGFLVFIALLLWTGSRIVLTRRVERLVQAAGQLAAGNLRTRVRLGGSDELAALGRAFDLMAQKIAQHQGRLYEHERQLRLLLESTAEGILGIDLNGQCTFCNPAAAVVLGYDNPITLLRKDFCALFPSNPNQDGALRQRLFNALEKSKKIYIPKLLINLNNGRSITVCLRIHPVAHDERADGAVATFMDISAMEERNKIIAKAAVVFQHSAEAIVVTDRNGVIEQANRAFGLLTGFEEKNAPGQPLAQTLKWDTLETTIWHTAESSGTWQGEIWQTRADDRVFPSWVTVSAVVQEEGDVESFIVMFTDITEKKNWEAHIERLAYHDALTNLPNRRLFSDRLQHAVDRARRRQGKIAVLFADLDRFKHINDTLGHNVGDRLLQEVARRISDSVRDQDTVARIGGDEFTVLLDDLNTSREPAIVAEKILNALNRPFYLDGNQLHIGVSIGISLFPDDGSVPDEITNNADAAMYAAKTSGRNRLQRFRQAGEELLPENRRFMEHELREALATDQLSIHFQPQVDLNDGNIVAVEALARWYHPERGYIPPLEFIALAESSDLALDIGEWVFNQAINEFSQWQHDAENKVELAINLSARQLNHGPFLNSIRDSLNAKGISPELLQLEISEHIFSDISAQNNEALCSLRREGIGITMDDFGVRTSCVPDLRDLPINRIKINRGFAQDLPHDRHTAAVISGMVALAHALDITIVAKGVEQPIQAEYFKQCNCDSAQGFLYYRPMPVRQLENTLLRCGSAPAQMTLPTV